MKRDFTDEQLSMLCGEALTDKPTREETAAEWEKFSRRNYIGEASSDTVHVVREKRSSRAMVTGIAAACLTAAALVGWLLLRWRTTDVPDGYTCFYAAQDVPKQVEDVTDDGYCTVSTPPATLRDVQLSDGTVVTLCANSSLVYPLTFGKTGRREVKLKGQACFKVTHDPDRPFTVDAGRMRVNVLGTTFVVKTMREEQSSVSLIEGRVNVASDGTSVDMVPGQTSVVDGEDIKISKADLEVATDWMHNQFVMDNMPLAEALETIGAWYNKTVVSQRSECMARRIHFRFSRKASLQEVVEALNEMKVANIKIEEGRIVVY